MRVLFISVFAILVCICNVLAQGLPYEVSYHYKGVYYKWEGTLESVPNGEVIASSDGCSEIALDMDIVYLEYNISVSCERKNRPKFDISLTTTDPKNGVNLFEERFERIPLLFSARAYHGYFDMLDGKGKNDKTLRFETVQTEYNYLHCP